MKEADKYSNRAMESNRAAEQESVLSRRQWKRTLHFRCRYRGDEKGSVLFSDLLAEDSPVIPGLRLTRAGEGVCSHAVVQAVCCDQSRIYLTAYCHCPPKGVRHDSMLHILDKRSGNYMGTVMIVRCHVGGIAIDEKKGCLYICNSRKKTMMTYSVQRILDALRNSSGRTLLPDRSFSVDITPSFCTFMDGVVWVGIFAKGETFLSGYIDRGDGYEKRYTLGPIESHAQGVAFCRGDYAVYVSVSRSYGWIASSWLDTYEIPDYGTSLASGGRMNLRPVLSMRMPSMMEGMDYDGEYLYAVYESACNTYRKDHFFIKSTRPCDRICRFERRALEQLFIR